MESILYCDSPLCQKTAMDLIRKCYLASVNNKAWLRSILDEKVLQPLSVETQENILNITVRSTISRLYPPPISFQKFFLRLLIEVVEHYGSELSDNLLHEYMQVLIKPAKEGFSYHNYVLNEETIITVQENPCFVANSTTGLRTWDASKFLSEWCIENNTLFNNRTILELGCGVGLLGLVILKTSHPKSITFTDKSWEVLNVLGTNIEINFNADKDWICLNSQHDEDLTSDSENTLSTETKIEKQILVWSEVTAEDATCLYPDIILGADLVYDPSMVQSLVHALKIFVANGACAYIASIVRNSGTSVRFTTELDSSGLQYEILTPQKKHIFIYDRTPKFILYKITNSVS